MKCSNCGKEITRVDSSMFDTRFKERAWGNNNENQLVSYAVLLCSECTAKRRVIQKCLYGAILGIVAIIALAAFLMK
jgi:hypothetical protein